MVIGLLGHGTIGLGVDRILNNLDGFSVKKILSLVEDEEMKGRSAKDIHDITNDPAIDTVVEVMGGIEPAYSFLKEAIENGKNVVTANKAVLSAHYEDLLSLSKQYRVSFRATASVGGGIPWLVNLERAQRVDTILEIGGILNGTTNYMLNHMSNDGVDFDTILKKAQELGYAEKDPSADIDGADIRRKINISANIAFHTLLPEEAIPAFGIRNIQKKDIENAAKMNGTIKLLAFAGKNPDGSLSVYVEPAIFPRNDLLSNIPENYNLAYFVGEYTGKECFTGQGAGRYPTAYNIVSDLVDIKASRPGFYVANFSPKKLSNESAVHRYYLRTGFIDDFLRDRIEEQYDGYVLTKEISVRDMHEWAEKNRENDPSLFFAAYKGE